MFTIESNRVQDTASKCKVCAAFCCRWAKLKPELPEQAALGSISHSLLTLTFCFSPLAKWQKMYLCKSFFSLHTCLISLQSAYRTARRKIIMRGFMLFWVPALCNFFPSVQLKVKHSLRLSEQNAIDSSLWSRSPYSWSICEVASWDRNQVAWHPCGNAVVNARCQRQESFLLRPTCLII